MALMLVTGGGGFIGSNLAAWLADAGHRVRVLDDFSTGRRQNLESLRDKIELVEGDICDMKCASAAVKDAACVFHLAALPSVPRSVRDPLTSDRVNTGGTLNMLVAARDAGVERFVFASSSSVYGESKVLPKVETMTPAPMSPYAVQKLTAEYYCMLFNRLYGLRTWCVRYFNVFGPRQNPDSEYAAAIPRFIRAIREGRSPVIFGDGGQTRDFTFVADAVAATAACASAPAESSGQVFNVAGGRRVSVNELVEVLISIIGSGVKPVYEPARAGDVRDSLAGLERAKAVLGWQPAVKLEDGLRKTVAWFKGSE